MFISVINFIFTLINVIIYDMKITTDEVKHLANLSNIFLSESEVENLRGDLEKIVNYIELLNELDTESVEPTYSVSNNVNVWREDEIDNYGVGRDELLALARENVLNDQVKVPKVL